MKNAAFHLSLPCKSTSKTRDFYSTVLGAEIGRHSHQWLDIDLFGNQITFTESGSFDFDYKSYKFEETVLPSFHFGVILDRASWNELFQRLIDSDYEVTTEITFLENKIGEHISFFIVDPNNYSVEFKSFHNRREIFKR